MTDSSSDEPRIALARLHALALATLRHADSARHRAYLDALADYAPDAEAFAPGDPRSDESLSAGVEPAATARRFAARLRGVILGAAAHSDTVAREAMALAREAVRGEGVADKDVEARAKLAFETVRKDLERDVVRLAGMPPVTRSEIGSWVRRWGVVRSLELNGFVATFTRDGTHAKAMRVTSEGRDAGALRFAMAASQAAMSLARDEEVGGNLEADVKRTETALTALLANVIAAAR